MNWNEIIKILLTATIPALLTYIATKRKLESKIKEITISKDSEIQQLKLKHQHEIDKLESDHKHSIEKLELEHKLQIETKNEELNSEMAMKFFTGELDLPKLVNSVENLDKLQKEIEKFNSKNSMSNFVKKK